MDEVYVTRTVTGDVLVLRVAGEIDLHTATGFDQRLRSAGATSTPVRVVVLDLTDVRFLSAAGLRPLVGLANECAGRGVRIRVVADPRGIVQRVLHLAGVVTLLPSFPTVVEAISGGDQDRAT